MSGSAKHKAFVLYKTCAEFFLKVPKKSHFTEKGVLTPDEFVAAGDLLVEKCPTWSWSAGLKNKTKDYLPAKKQFLITTNVPCMKRCSTLMQEAKDEEEVEGGWVTTHMKFATEKAKEHVEDIGGDDSDSDVIDDIDDFLENSSGEDEEDMDLVDNTNILKTRRYDLSITYDKYYQTPRVWLFGYSKVGKELTTKQILEDIHVDYSNKTVTIEQHPHLMSQHAGIHPCKHAQLMKKMIDMLAEDERYIRVDLYLFLFLKFISSVIPTITYDFTIEVDSK